MLYQKHQYLHRITVCETNMKNEYNMEQATKVLNRKKVTKVHTVHTFDLYFKKIMTGIHG